MVDPRHLGSVSGDAVCSGPGVERLVLTDLVTTDPNRWNREGEPTLYLAGDLGVALAELGRHHREPGGTLRIWRVRLSLDAALDLRDDPTRGALGVPDDPRWYLDRDRCRDLAARARATPGCDGLIVPTVAVLDDPQRWNAVVFADVPDRPLEAMVSIEGPALDVVGVPHGGRAAG